MRSYILELDFAHIETIQKHHEYLRLLETLYAKELLRKAAKGVVCEASFYINSVFFDEEVVEEKTEQIMHNYYDPIEPEYLDRLYSIISRHVLTMEYEFLSLLLHGGCPIIWISILSSTTVLIAMG